MPLTIDQYASFLDTRDLPWPAPPDPAPPRAKPHLPQLPGIRAVLWNVYGTLLAVTEGELKFETENAFLMEVALEKTIHEFKMWNFMSRKPGQPSAYMREIYMKALNELRLAPSAGERHPEIAAEKIWESIIKKLKKEYTYDVVRYGATGEFSKKVAYFFHASLQGAGGYPGLAEALSAVAGLGVAQGLLADGQCFTEVQLHRALQRQDASANLDALIPPARRWLSIACHARKPSETIFRTALRNLKEAGIEGGEILHIGSSIARDIVPAKKLGWRTGLFAGDRNSLAATPEQLKDPQQRPDVLLTELPQVAQVIG